MEHSNYDSPWTDPVFDHSFWQQMLNWVNTYFQQHVGVMLDGPLSEGEQAHVEAWFSDPNNVYDYVQAFYSQTFFQEFVDSLPDYGGTGDHWDENDDDFGDLSDFFALFSGDDGMQWPGLDDNLTDLFDDLFNDDGLLDDAPTGPPFQPVMAKPVVEDMALLYEAALDRVPDLGGLNYFVGDLRGGQSLQNVANSFYHSEEFRSQFDELDNISYVNQLYENVLNRAADQQGLDYWIHDIEHNGRSHADVLVSFAQSEENRSNAADWLAGLQFNSTTDEWVF